MNSLVAELKYFIADHVRAALSTEPDRVHRVVFSGPSPEIMIELAAELTGARPHWRIDIEAGPIDVPVFLLDSSAKDPTTLKSGRCTAQYITEVRNSPCRVFVVLQPPAESGLLTLDSTMIHIGVPVDVGDVEGWLDNALVRAVMNDIVELAFGVGAPAGIHNALRSAFAAAWIHDSGSRSHHGAWGLLNAAMASAASPDGGADALVATLGQIRCDVHEIGSDDHLGMLSWIAKSVSDSNFGPFFADLLEAASDINVKRALGALEGLLRRRCRTGTKFAASPAYYFAPEDPRGLEESSQWWGVLDLAVWRSLRAALSQGSEDQASICVTCADVLLRGGDGLPTLVRNSVNLDIELKSEFNANEIAITRKIARRPEELLGVIRCAANELHHWNDDAVPEHGAPIVYAARAVGCKPAAVKVVSLATYEPGLVVVVPSARRQILMRPSRAAGQHDGVEAADFECRLDVNGAGTHHVDIYKGEHVDLGGYVTGHDTTLEGDGPVTRAIICESADKARTVFETDDECFYDIAVTRGGVATLCRVNISASEHAQIGVGSQYRRLVAANVDGRDGVRKGARVDVRSTLLCQLGAWILAGDDTFEPILLAPDFDSHWREPSWQDRPIVGTGRPLVDARPPRLASQESVAYSEARASVRQVILKHLSGNVLALEMVRLDELMLGGAFADLVRQYLLAYANWLAVDYERAAWADVVGLLAEESARGPLASRPFAMLLNPMHPVRIAWQCQAQLVLGDALTSLSPCPAAGILDSAYFPDCLALPCLNASRAIELQPYVAVDSDSDYWSVLWHTATLGSGERATRATDVGDALGIRIGGLGRGLTESQVARTLEEVARMSAAKSSLGVSIWRGDDDRDECNAGLATWAGDTLGPAVDTWFSAGPRGLTVYDRRARRLQPEQSDLASMSARSGGVVAWFDLDASQSSPECDVALVPGLGSASCELSVHNVRSAVDVSQLARVRIRKQIVADGNVFIGESRVRRAPPDSADPSNLASLLGSCCAQLENVCATIFDSVVFAPNLRLLGDASATARFSAVSAAAVDVSCFLDGHAEKMLWDYEVPDYSHTARGGGGYFLFARNSEPIRDAVRRALRTLSSGEDVSAATVEAVFAAVAQRGMPTLKHLTAGGAASIGEMGVIVALELLCGANWNDADFGGIAPALRTGEIVTVVVPVDPFLACFDALRGAMREVSRERPDLVVISVDLASEQVVRVRVVPVEVKARSDLMGEAGRERALGQAAQFGRFLVRLAELAGTSDLWAIAWRDLLGSWTDFGFRTGARRLSGADLERWNRSHERAMASLLDGKAQVEVDARGRLLAVEECAISQLLDADNDGYCETLVISHKDAFALLTEPAEAVDVIALCRQVGDWDFPAIGTGGDDERIAGVGADGVVDGGGQAEVVTDDLDATEDDGGNGDGSVSPELATTGLVIPVGVTVGAAHGRVVEFRAGDTRLNQLNIGIVGDLGTGKTQLVQSLIYRMREGGTSNRGVKPKFLIFDYKRDYSNPRFVAATGARVVKPDKIPLSLFDIRESRVPARAWLERSRFFSDVLSKIFGRIGPVQHERLKDAVRASFGRLDGIGAEFPTLRDVFDEYRQLVDSPDSAYAIMSDLVDGGYFEEDANSVVRFPEFLDGIVVIDLSAVGADDRTKNMLVVVFLNLFYEHMLRIEKQPYIGSAPQWRAVDTMVLVDEADNIMKYEFEVLKNILLQGREFGVGVLLASQYLRHFKTPNENYAQPLLTWFIHKVPDITAQELQRIGLVGGLGAVPDRIKGLRVHECLYKSYDNAGVIIRGTPFFEIVDAG